MSRMNFSIPNEVKRRFNETFAHRNKSEVIAELMEQAMEQEQRKVRRSRAVDNLLARRARRPVVAEEEVRWVREELRECP